MCRKQNIYVVLGGHMLYNVNAFNMFTELSYVGSFTVHLLIFFWVGFRWDGHYGPKMGGMDPTCQHPKPRPTNPRDFLTHHFFRTEMESSKSPEILIQRYFQTYFQKRSQSLLEF